MNISQDMQTTKAAGTCIATIFCQEFPRGEWAEFVQIMTALASSENLFHRKGSVYTIGLITEELDSKFWNTEFL